MPCSTLRTDYDICLKEAPRADVKLERMRAWRQATGQFQVQLVPRGAWVRPENSRLDTG